MNTLLLNPQTWDLCIDANGNIAMASGPYAIAQDVTSALLLYQGELWYDTTQGVPYFQQILGQLPPLALLKSELETAALTVPGVVTATAVISAFTNRTLSGQIQVTDSTGAVIPVVIPTFGNFTLDSSTL